MNMTYKASAALGVMEVYSIGKGLLACDAMLKKAEVRLILARVICPGKYLAAVQGNVAEVRDALDGGLAAAGDTVVDSLVLPSPHPDVFSAITQTTAVDRVVALGLIETFTMCSALEAADAAAKQAEVSLLEIRLSIMLAGKSYICLTGAESAVKEALDAGAALVREKGMLVSAIMIPRPDADLLKFVL